MIARDTALIEQASDYHTTYGIGDRVERDDRRGTVTDIGDFEPFGLLRVEWDARPGEYPMFGYAYPHELSALSA